MTETNTELTPQAQQGPISHPDQPNPRIYVACLAAYNNGQLHGSWIDVDGDENAIWEAVRSMLKSSPQPEAEEWAIHDYDGFEGVNIEEYDSFARVIALADFIQNCPVFGAKLLANFNGNMEEAENALERYAGQYCSLADFAQELTEETTPIPETLKHYIDYDAMSRDMEMNGDVFAIETAYQQIHVFWG